MQSFRGLATTKIEVADQKDSFRQIIAFNKPDKLQLQLLPRGGSYAFSILNVTAREAVWLDTVEKQAVLAKDAERLLENYLHLSFSVSDLLAYFVGSLPLTMLSNEQSEQYSAFLDNQERRLAIVGEQRESYWLLTADSHDLLEFEKREASGRKLLFRIQYDNYQMVNGCRLPSHIKIFFPADDLQIHLRFSTLNVNSPSKKDLYNLAIPEGYKVIKKS